MKNNFDKKPGSIEDVVAGMTKHTRENAYQDKFKKEQIKIDPEIKFDVEVTDFGVLISGDFEQATAYEVTVNENITSIYGRNLNSEYVANINFSNVEPSVDFSSKNM